MNAVDKVAPDAPYEQRFALLNRSMRWEVADLLRDEYLDSVDRAVDGVVPRDGFYVRHGKRAIDVAFSGFALFLTLPINLLVAAATIVTLGRPILFRQKRLGKDGELFTLVKFRNMREEFDKNGHPLPGASRVTRLGKFMRRTSLDELLNFWSIFKGDMSLIGPRPLVPEYADRYSTRHRGRMCVKPGLECPALSGARPIRTYDDQFDNDAWYAENVSLSLDVKLVCRLVLQVFDRQESKRRAAAEKGSFLGYGNDGTIVTSFTVPDTVLNRVLRHHGLLSEDGQGSGSVVSGETKLEHPGAPVETPVPCQISNGL